MDKVTLATLMITGDVVIVGNDKIGIYNEESDVETVYIYDRPGGPHWIAFAELEAFEAYRFPGRETLSTHTMCVVFNYILAHYTTVYRVIFRELIYVFNKRYHPAIHWFYDGFRVARHMLALPDNPFRAVMTPDDIRKDWLCVGKTGR